VCFYMEDDAGALVRRPALKTGFSEMGWGSTPPSSANFNNEGCLRRLVNFIGFRNRLPLIPESNFIWRAGRTVMQWIANP
jgi:hypothetical protein